MADTPTLRNGRFVLGQPIGEGAQGRTFDGVDTRAPEGGDRAVAIKRFDVRGATSWKDVELAEREARVLQSLSHPKLPAYVDHFEEDGALYLVMEKIDGESLGAYRSCGATLGEAEVVRLLRDASEVLDYLHRRVPPVIHRDLKPGNVIRRPDGSFAFVDFGAVRDKLRHKGGSTVVGTFGYMAPEQMQGRALPASDVYAIGATALAMLTDHEPEELPHRGLALDVRQALRPHADSRRGSRAADSGPSARLVEVLQRMLEPDPDRRASRIAPLLAGLDSLRTDDPHERNAGAERYSRNSARRARRAARRAQRRAGRIAHWEAVRTRQVPWPARLVFMFLLSLGIVAVSFATQIVVPMVLGLLSLFLARRPLTNAAEAVRNAGNAAVDGMQWARRRWLHDGVGEPHPEDDSRARVRVGEESIPQARIGEDDNAADAVDPTEGSTAADEKPRSVH